jgi:hypothetical protein
MKIAFVADPLSSFKIHKDSTYAMMVESLRILNEDSGSATKAILM